MFFRFPPDAGGTPTETPSSSVLGWASTRVWCGFLGACSNPASRSAHARTLPRSLPSTPDPERKAHRRQLNDDGNVEITGRDLREREAPPASRRIAYRRFAR